MNILYCGNFPDRLKTSPWSFKTYSEICCLRYRIIREHKTSWRSFAMFKLHRDVSDKIHDYVEPAELAVLKGQRC